LKKKICFVINKPSVGGAELFLLKLITKIKDDFDCYIIFLSENGELLEEFKIVTKKLFILDLRINLLSVFTNHKKIVKIFGEIKPDVVHTWLYISDIFGGCAAFISGVPKIFWSIRQSNISYSQNKLHTFLLSRISGILSCIIPDKIVSCSEVAKNIHIRKAFYKSSKILVIPNGYDLDYLKFDDHKRQIFRDELQVKKTQFIIGIIGRYDIQKGFDNFIKIAHLITQNISNIQFVLVGPGCTNDNIDLINLMKEYSFGTKFILLGARSDIRPVLCGLDLLIIPSRGEAFPNILGEAMSLGTMVLTTNVGEIPIILKDIQKTFSPGSNHEMADEAKRIIKMNKSESEKHSTKLRNRIEEKYSINQVVNDYKKLYSN